MKCHIQRKLGSGRPLLMVWGGILLGISLCGLSNRALASDRQIPFHVDSGRLTGQLNQVTLRTVLGQLHAQLGLDYIAPDPELEKVISVSLQKEPLPKALSKILAQWDYAFTLDAAGNITTLHVMAKVSQGKGSESPEQKVSEHPKSGLIDHGSDMGREDPTNKKVLSFDLQTKGNGKSGEKVFNARDVPMEIRPPALGTSMTILPASSNEMLITPGGSARVMEIIPPTAYPPMNIQPVPKYMQQEMLLPLNP